MNRSLVKNSFKLQIFTIFFIPTVVLIHFTATYVSNKYETMQKSSHSYINAKFTKKLEELIHNVQIERGLSAGYITTSSLSNDIKKRLAIQRKKTDESFQKITNFVELNSKEINNFYKIEYQIKDIVQKLSQIGIVREKIDNKLISFDDEMNFYTTLDKKLLHIIYILATKSKRNDPLVDLFDVYKIQEMKEYAGIERASIFNQILSKHPSEKLDEQIRQSILRQEQYKEEFLSTATLLDLKIYSKSIDEQLYEKIKKYREKLFARVLTKEDGLKWFDISSNYINQLKIITDEMLEEYQKQMRKKYAESKNALYLAALLWVLLFISFIILAIVLLRLINKQTKMMEDLRIAAYVFNAKEAITITDSHGNILRVNGAFTKITGYTEKEVLGKNPSILKSGRHDEKFYEKMWKDLHIKGYWHGEIYNKRKNGEIYAEQLSITAITDPQGNVTHFIAQFLDVSELKQAQDEALYQANHDFLTKLPNRKLMMNKLEEEFERTRKEGEIDAFFFIDIDGFKKINDLYGHKIGDDLLIEIASCIKGCIKENDLVSRISGDEFCVILQTNSKDFDIAKQFSSAKAQEILEKISNIKKIGRYTIQISASMGIRLFPKGIIDVNDIINGADTAMYKAKEQGKNQYVYFDKQLESKIRERLIIENELEDALINNEIKFYFQPKFDIAHSKIYGAELLIRWEHPQKGILYPGYFLDVAKDMQLLPKFTKKALHVSCDFIKHYGDMFEGTLSLNTNSSELSDDTHIDEIISIIENYKIDESKLEFEILESELIHDFDAVIKNIKKLKSRGIQFSIDDFGTGYSSISYLEKLPIDTLKIDRYFIQNIHENTNKDLVLMIINIGRTFGFKIIIEGVETIEQVEFLKEHNVRYYQGFLFSKAIDEKSFTKMITLT